MASDADSRIKVYELKITLNNISPPIWRRVKVTPDINLGFLHMIIQSTMGWNNCHMHMFIRGKQRFGAMEYEDDMDMLDEQDYTIGELLPRKGSKIIYEYDFGDSWEHLVKVEKTLYCKPDEPLPRCLDGRRACPPEDCGGTWGYGELLRILNDSTHPEREERLEWLGSRNFDPEHFSVEEANRRMAKNLSAYFADNTESEIMTRDEIRQSLLEVDMEDPDDQNELAADICYGNQNAGKDLAWLAAHDLNPDVHQHAVIILNSILSGEFEPFGTLYESEEAEMKLFTEQVKTVILDALHNPKIPDDRKMYLLPLASTMNIEFGPDEPAAFFKDFETTRTKARKQMCETITDSPGDMEHLLELLNMLPGQDRIPDEETCHAAAASALDMAVDHERAGLFLLASVIAACGEYNIPTAPLLEIIPNMDKITKSNTAWPLRVLAGWPNIQPLGDEIAKLLERKSMGNDNPPRLFFEREFAHAVASVVDGAGSRSVMLFFRTNDGGMDAINFLLNRKVGFKDIWTVYNEGDNVMNQIQESSELHIPCCLDFARELIAHTMLIHQEKNKSFPCRLFLAMPYFGEKPLVPRKRTPNLGAYMLETMRHSPELVKDSGMLVKATPYNDLWFASDHLYDYLRTKYPGRNPKRKLGKKDLKAFMRQITPDDLDFLASTIADTLEIEALGGRAKHKHNQVAARLYLALTENIVPPLEIPLVKIFAEISVRTILENLKQGYTTQAQANQARMELDAEMDMNLKEVLDHAMNMFELDNGPLDDLEISREELQRRFEEMLSRGMFTGEDFDPNDF